MLPSRKRDFTDEFLTGVHPAATVVSSGGQESHAHPRSDTLGAIRMHGRGSRPLILAPSSRVLRAESADPKARKELRDLQAQIDGAATETERAELRRKYNEVLDGILDRFVAVYGAINLRTDGEKALLAYKLETPRAIGQTVTNWDIYRWNRTPMDSLPTCDLTSQSGVSHATRMKPD